jgi:hypothetical protein
VNISNEFQQVAFGIYQHSVEPPFEQVPRGRQSRLDRSRIAAGDAQNDSAQRNVGYLQEQMYVIGHPAVGVNSRGEPFNAVGNNRVEQISVGLREEYGPPVIPPQRHMVEPAGYVNTKRARHAGDR